jgi:hypothetical protein
MNLKSLFNRWTQLVLWVAAAGGLTALATSLAQAQASKEVAAPKAEVFLLLPEPVVMRSARSLKPPGAVQTVFSPAKEVPTSPFIATYSTAEFNAIGISPETFAERARSVADGLLRNLQPDWVRGDDGKVAYAVFRGERPIYASLLVAPSLPKLFEAAFGPEIWVVAPDRNALYVFPAKAEALSDFAGDLQARHTSDPYAASSEIFSWKKGQREPQVVGSFAD